MQRKYAKKKLIASERKRRAHKIDTYNEIPPQNNNNNNKLTKQYQDS